jgi:hypothetical protein
MPAEIPTVKLNLPVGHIGTYGAPHAGKFGQAAVLFFKWQMKGDKSAGAQFLNPAASSLTSEGWTIESKGFSG